MAIIGIGTDIVKISRIRHLAEKYKDSFSSKILHNNEMLVYLAHSSPYAYLAKRFCAKEATVKAFGTGIAQGISFKDIEISNNKNGQPAVIFHGKAREYADQLGVTHQYISLSDEKKYAIAYVLLEHREPAEDNLKKE